jgi:hypothetical protein
MTGDAGQGLCPVSGKKKQKYFRKMPGRKNRCIPGRRPAEKTVAFLEDVRQTTVGVGHTDYTDQTEHTVHIVHTERGQITDGFFEN